ncbi:MAG: translesion error-prone DNA polymerase V subunit UmuC [Oleiphilaceae bacterium]|nr:translesion error-prone DNA polymerase V subunit UmuC [Oleiphilaceae bacterium]
MFALVDCNNFYASCEKLFRPDLRQRPVVVLSNNDGCVVARSAEAKALGIKMGVPVFQIRDTIRRHDIVVFSSNYALYADMSSRVMRVLEDLAPAVELYSIDESFLDLTGVASAMALSDFGTQVRRTVRDWTGLPVCVGMAPSKTLAKLANYGAKKYPATGGVVDLSDPCRQRRLLALAPVEEVWGVGQRLTRRLNALGIHSALDLARADPAVMRRHFSVVLERTVRELNGESCLPLEPVAATKQQILCSRSFGERVLDYDVMAQAISGYTVRAAEKLRGEKQAAAVLTVFIRTSPFNRDEPQYANSATTTLPFPTDDTRLLLQAARRLLKTLWRNGYRYSKGGVTLSGFHSPGVYQPGLFDRVHERPRSRQLMATLDCINRRSSGAVWFAGEGVRGQAWSMKRGHLSPAYTTRWSDLLPVH